MLTNTQDILSKSVLLHGIDILNKCQVDPESISNYLERVLEERLDYPVPKDHIDPTNWLIPESYKKMDIAEWLVDNCPASNYSRLADELELFEKNGMIPVLKTMKYLVDTFRENNVVWGVGRGSSVASYVLHIIGVHKIDSVKYNIPIEEFFKGDQNG